MAARAEEVAQPVVTELSGKQTRWVGKPMRRREDVPLLVGSARFLADLAGPETAHVGFVRSIEAHANLTRVDGTAAAAMPGIHAVVTGADLPGDLPPQPATHHLGTRPTPYFALTRDRVRYVGEAVAAVVGASPTAVADAMGAVEVEYEELPVVSDARRAIAPDAPVIFDGWPDNVAGAFEVDMGSPDEAIAASDVVLSERIHIARQAACPMEGRGALAKWDPHLGKLTLWTSTQSPHIVRDLLAEVTGLPTHKVRVRVPAVGGGFGAKFHFYAEESAVALLAIMLERPVLWTESRRESFVATVHARDQSVDVTIAADRDGTITAITAEVVADMGAYLHMVSFGPAWLTSVMMTGAYSIPNARARMQAVVTNSTPTGSYRGWGQPEANFVVERMVDLVAAELEIDRAEIRRRNFVKPAQFPYTSLFHTFDSGRYEECLDRGLDLGRYDEWRAYRDSARGEGRHVGLGMSFYVENTALGPSRQMNEGGLDQGGYDISNIRMEPGGEVMVYTGLCEMGQGFTNGLAQMCAETLGVHVDAVTVVSGDTDACPYTGHGTGASRSAAVGGAAVRKAAGRLREQVLHIAGYMLEAAEDDLVIDSGRIWVRGSPDISITTADVGRAAYLRAIELPPDIDPGLEVIEVFDPPQMAWPYGLNLAVVEVDIETCDVEVLDYAIFHDCGTILNPMIVAGQLHGGAAQGIGAALSERLLYDDAGQLLTTTFMSYAIPSAPEVPSFQLGHMVTPSTVIPGGMKGVGEAGIIGPPAALVAAIEDALAPYDVTLTSIPVTRQVIFEAVRGRYASRPNTQTTDDQTLAGR